MTRRQALFLTGIVIFGLAARVAYVQAQGGWWQQGDWNWVRMADSLRRGDGLVIDDRRIVVGAMRAHKMPVYAWVLAGAFEIAGRVPGEAKSGGVGYTLLHAGFGAMSIWLAFAIGRRLAGETAGLWSAALVAFHPHAMAIDGQMGEHSLSTALLLASALALERWTAVGRRRDLVAFGLLAGVTLLTRASFLLLYAPVCLLLVRGRAPGIRSRLLHGAVAGALIALCLAPWVVRNATLLGKPTIITGGGRSLWIGNNDIMLSHPDLSADEVEHLLWERSDEAFREEISGLSELDREAAFRREALRWIREDPVRWARLAALKAAMGMGPFYSPGNQAGTGKVLLVGGTYVLLLILGTVGFLALRGRGRAYAWFVLLTALSLVAQSAIYWCHTRHRVPFDVVLAILAGVGAARILRRRPSGTAGLAA